MEEEEIGDMVLHYLNQNLLIDSLSFFSEKWCNSISIQTTTITTAIRDLSFDKILSVIDSPTRCFLVNIRRDNERSVTGYFVLYVPSNDERVCESKKEEGSSKNMLKDNYHDYQLMKALRKWCLKIIFLKGMRINDEERRKNCERERMIGWMVGVEEVIYFKIIFSKSGGSRIRLRDNDNGDEYDMAMVGDGDGDETYNYDIKVSGTIKLEMLIIFVKKYVEQKRTRS